METAKQQKA